MFSIRAIREYSTLNTEQIIFIDLWDKFLHLSIESSSLLHMNVISTRNRTYMTGVYQF